MSKDENTMEHDEELTLGRYSDDDLMEVIDGDGQGGALASWSVVISIATWISDQTCPTTACSHYCR